jgi:hypothetical protein
LSRNGAWQPRARTGPRARVRRRFTRGGRGGLRARSATRRLPPRLVRHRMCGRRGAYLDNEVGSWPDAGVRTRWSSRAEHGDMRTRAQLAADVVTRLKPSLRHPSPQMPSVKEDGYPRASLRPHRRERHRRRLGARSATPTRRAARASPAPRHIRRACEATAYRDAPLGFPRSAVRSHDPGGH